MEGRGCGGGGVLRAGDRVVGAYHLPPESAIGYNNSKRCL